MVVTRSDEDPTRSRSAASGNAYAQLAVLYPKMVQRPTRATTAEFVEALKRVKPDMRDRYLARCAKDNVDVPGFEVPEPAVPRLLYPASQDQEVPAPQPNLPPIRTGRAVQQQMRVIPAHMRAAAEAARQRRAQSLPRITNVTLPPTLPASFQEAQPHDTQLLEGETIHDHEQHDQDSASDSDAEPSTQSLPLAQLSPPAPSTA